MDDFEDIFGPSSESGAKSEEGGQGLSSGSLPLGLDEILGGGGVPSTSTNENKGAAVAATYEAELDDLFGALLNKDPIPTSTPALSAAAPAPAAVASALPGTVEVDEEFADIFGSPLSSTITSTREKEEKRSSPSSFPGKIGDSVSELYADLDLGTSSKVTKNETTPQEDGGSAGGHSEFLAWLEETPGRLAKDRKSDDNTAAAASAAAGTDSGAFRENKDHEREIEGQKIEDMPQPSFKSNPRQELERLAEAYPARDIDVEHVRRLSQSLGSFLPAELRINVWSILLGLGDAEDTQRELDAWLATGGLQRAATMPRGIDILRDATSLAERIKSAGDFADDPDQAAITADELVGNMRTIVFFFCVKQNLRYESVMCHVAAPLVCLTRDMGVASELFYRMVNAYTLFLSTGLSEEVRCIAERQAHRQFYFLLAYHAPHLAQHLDRCWPGWEMPSIVGVSARAEAQRQSDEAEAFIDDLESRASGMRSWHASKESDDYGEGGGNMSSSSHGGGGSINHSALGGLFSGLSLALACPATLLPLWDYYLIRRDKYFGYFLLLTILLRNEKELLSLTLSDLRVRLPEILCADDFAATLDAKGVHEWCLEAEALDMATPESFRFTIASIGETAQAEFTIAKEQEREQQQRSIAAPPPSSGRTDIGREGGDDTEGAEGGPPPPGSRITPSVDTKNLSEVPSMFAEGGATTPRKAVVSSSKATPASLKLAQAGRRMKEMMADVSKRMVEQVEAVKRDSSSASARLTGEPQPHGYESSTYSMPQLCVTILPDEMIASIGRKEGKGKVVGSPPRPRNRDPEKKFQGLHQKRKPINYFAIDCRPGHAASKGRFPTAYHLDPAKLQDPDEISTVLEVLDPLLGKAHICLLGGGEAHLASQYRMISGSTISGASIPRSVMEDYSCVNSCAIFLAKRGFPYVSVVKGGYAAAHEILARVSSMGVSPHETDSMAKIDLSTLVDHSPQECRLCKHEALRKFSHEGRAHNRSSTSSGVLVPSERSDAVAAAESLSAQKTPRRSSLLGVLSAQGASSSTKNWAALNLGGFGTSLRRGSDVKNERAASSEAQISATSARKGALMGSLLTKVRGGSPPLGSSSSLQVTEADAPSIPPTLDLKPLEVSHSEDIVDSGLFIIGGDESDTDDDASLTLTEDKKKEIALLEHRLSGMIKGASIEPQSIEELPGSVSFGVHKLKVSDDGSVIEVPRVLLLTRERVLVLNSPPGQGGAGEVRSNRHLTQISRMTYKKNDPTSVTLFHTVEAFQSGATKGNSYRLGNTTQRDQLISELRHRLLRFQCA